MKKIAAILALLCYFASEPDPYTKRKEDEEIVFVSDN